MYEEGGLIRWENILTILIGIAIVASVYLIIYRRRNSKRRRIQQDAELLEIKKQLMNKEETIENQNTPSQ